MIELEPRGSTTKPPWSGILFVVGCLFLVQAAVVVSLLDAHADDYQPRPGDSAQEIMLRTRISVVRIEIAKAVSVATGSVIGCLGSWLLAFHLRVKRLEKRIVELEGFTDGRSPG